MALSQLNSRAPTMTPDIGTALIVACDARVQIVRLRMFSSVLEQAGYDVRILGSSDALGAQPRRVGGIKVQPDDLDLAVVGAGDADLIFALDPRALLIARNAAARARERGVQTRVGYDLWASPVPGSGAADREAAAMADLAFATAASLPLARDGRWPTSLGGVPVVYPAPLELAASQTVVAQLRKALGTRRTPSLGIFLAQEVPRELRRSIASLARTLPEVGAVVVGAAPDVKWLTRWDAVRPWRLKSLPLPDPDDTPGVVSELDIIVCPSAWNAVLPPSAAAIACVAADKHLVASPAVAEELGVEVGVAGTTVDDVATAVRDSIALFAARRDGERLPKRCRRRFTYDRQLEVLRGLVGGRHERKLGIGPRNGNGQAWAWAQALRGRLPSLPVEVFAAEYTSGRIVMEHQTDVSIALDDWKRREWQLWWAHRLRTQFTHLLIEQGLTGCGLLNGSAFFQDVPPLLRGGLRVGLVFRGSDIRDPAEHAKREPWSPFADADDPLTARLQGRGEKARRALPTLDVPKFVTTLDLLDDVPDATWLPQVLDLQEWRAGPAILEKSRPVVLHAPSSAMKGSQWVDAACDPLHEAGVINYQRLHEVPFAEMPARLRAADIVIDQLALGSYGVLALQAMACERLVIGHVSDHVRSRLGAPIPVLEAEPPKLRSVLEEALAAREWARAFARSGREYVCRFHAGAESAERLDRYLVAQPPG